MTFAFDPSLNCFFNALLREWSNWAFSKSLPSFLSSHSDEINECGTPKGYFVFEGGDGKLCIPCGHYSIAGRHQLLKPCLVVGRDRAIRSIETQEAFEWLLRECRDFDFEKASTKQFLSRAKQSDNNLKKAVRFLDADLSSLFSSPLTFQQAEAALFTGHSIHPCPKARDNFSEQDALDYAPEFQGRFNLHWYRLKRQYLYSRFGGDDEGEGGYEVLAGDLITYDPKVNAWKESLAEDEVLFPCHPFQHQIWQNLPQVQALIQQGGLEHLGTGSVDWSATTSVRAIYSPYQTWMLKFSLSVKLTNSIRHIQPAELVRGAELYRVLACPPAQEFVERFPNFTILKEPLAASLISESGEVIEESIVLWRENPFISGNVCNKEVLATLLQDDPRNGQSRLEQRLKQLPGRYIDHAKEWFVKYLDVVVRPLIIAQGDYGLLFGAHQQNIVLGLDSVMPSHFYFRDCQGTGFTDLAYQLFSPYVSEMAADSGNLVDDDLAIRLFGYYLIVNATFNVISSLCRDGTLSEQSLIQLLRDFLQQLLTEGVKDSQCIEYLLHEEFISAKGNFMVSLKLVNDTTETDYLSLYHPLANPLVVKNEIKDIELGHCSKPNLEQGNNPVYSSISTA